MSRVPLLFALLLSISVSTFAQSQANTGNIEGRVTDPNAASVPNVTVTATKPRDRPPATPFGGPRTFLGERQIQLGVRFKF